MAFTIYNWSEVSTSLNQGLVSAAIATPSSDATVLQGSMNIFSYYTTDALASVNSANYFLPVVIDLSLSDIIFVTAADGTEIIQVTGITDPTDTTTGSVVTSLYAVAGSSSSLIRSATFTATGGTASTVILDPAITAASVVLARFVSSANLATVELVLPAAGQVTVTSNTAPGACVIEYISFTPSARLEADGVFVGKGSYAGGSATFTIADANVTAGMVVAANFQSQGNTALIYTASAGAGIITIVANANPGASVVEYAAMLPGTVPALNLYAATYANAGGSSTIAITDAGITATSIVSADFKSQANVSLIQKVTPTAGTLTILASADPGVSVLEYMATAQAGGGTTLSNSLPSGQIFVGNASGIATPVTMTGDATLSNTGALSLIPAINVLTQVAMTAAQFNGMYAAPVLLVAAAGANTMIIVDSIELVMTYGSAAFAAGGVVAAQYDSTPDGAGVIASTTEAAADFFQTASTVFKLKGGLVLAPFTTCANKGLYLSNVTQPFTTGTGSSFIVKVKYHVISTTS